MGDSTRVPFELACPYIAYAGVTCNNRWNSYFKPMLHTGCFGLILCNTLAIIVPFNVNGGGQGRESPGTGHSSQIAGSILMVEKRKVLVVDDEEALRTVLSSELVSEGYEVVTASDGDEAINEIQKQSFDMVLLDIKMQRVNGFEVLKFVKDKHPKTKVIMLTGFADLKNAIESKKLGAEDFVSKPYDLVDLLTTIERVMSE